MLGPLSTERAPPPGKWPARHQTWRSYDMSDKLITTVEEAFESFECNTARVPDDENADAKAVHPEIRKAVTAAFPNTEHFLSGSYGRRTQAMKLKDVDIIVVLNDPDGKFKASASQTLEDVREVVSDHELVRTTRVSVRAVKAFLHDYEFHVDIVPALVPAFGSGWSSRGTCRRRAATTGRRRTRRASSRRRRTRTRTRAASTCRRLGSSRPGTSATPRRSRCARTTPRRSSGTPSPAR